RAPRCVAPGDGRPARLGARQRAALDLVAGFGSCDERTLQRETGLSASALDSLLRAGALCVVEPAACAPPASPGPPPPALLPEQAAALALVVAAMDGGGEVLLHGVTGSG